MPKTVATKPYDWTYTTIYTGHTEPEESRFVPSWTSSDETDPAYNIPIAELTRPDPILFYAEIPLFEDELHDNGSSALIVRIVSRPFRLTVSELTRRLACHANMYFYSLPIHPPSRQRTLSYIGHKNLSFLLIGTFHDH